MFSGAYAHWHQQRHRDLRTHNHLNADYQIFQTQRDEPLMQRVRTELSRSGVLVEGSMGECSPGQQELNLRYTEALAMADAHALAKWHPDMAGSSSHIHLSLWDTKSGQPSFLYPQAEHGMSALMRRFVAGLIAHGAATTRVQSKQWRYSHRAAHRRRRPQSLCGLGGHDQRWFGGC